MAGSLYNDLPAFRGLDAEAVTALIHRARLSKVDERIAIERYVCRAGLVDIGAIVYLNRTSVSYRLRRIIIPQIEATVKRGSE